MKTLLNFLSSFVAALCALAAFFVFLPIAVILIFFAAAASESEIAPERESTCLVVNLSDQVADSCVPADLPARLVGEKGAISLRSLCARILRAGAEGKIKTLLLCGSLEDSYEPLSYAQVSELRAALEGFKKRGGSVEAHLENPSTRDYYLASCASKISLNPMSELELKGIGGGAVFFGNALKKYGVDATVVKVGKLKSFGEMFTASEMSAPVRENCMEYLGSVWSGVVSAISKSRKIPEKTIRAAADTKALLSAKEALDLKLVDSLEYRDELVGRMKKIHGENSAGTFSQTSVLRYPEKSGAGAKYVAVVYMNGDILEASRSRSDSEISASAFCPLIRDLRADPDCAAAVVRLNSGGGSAYASELIRRELELFAREKPLVASIGSCAASGAYWIATASREIYAEPASLTGSIGVFSLLFSAKKMAGDFGITFDAVKTSPMADIGAISRAPTKEEIARLQKLTDDTYEKFVSLVCASRKMPREKVEPLADGRVFSGSRAKELGLVDAEGSLADAVSRARVLSGAKIARAEEFPKREILSDFIDAVAPLAGGDFAKSKTLKPIFEAARAAGNLKAGAYARAPFDFEIK